MIWTLIWIFLYLSLAVGWTSADHIPTRKHHKRLEVPFQIGTPVHAVPNVLPSPSAIAPSSSDSQLHLSPSVHPTDLPRPPPNLPVVLKGDSLQIQPPAPPQRSNAPGSNSQISNADIPQGPLVMGYYPDWAADTFPPEVLDFGRYDWIDFAFAVPNADFSLGWDSEDAPDILRRLVLASHAKRSKVKLSIGGWTGSKYFSPAVSTPESRQKFSNNILSTYSLYGLDGVDIDWEYPGHEGNSGNIYDSRDTRNLLAFLKVLRNTLPPSARISAAVQTFPFMDEDGEPLSDTSEFAAVLDWVLIMNYDTWGSSSSPGPNAPLYDACGNSTQPEASALSSYKAWTKSGFPPSQLVLGLPAYGYVQKSFAQRLRNRDYEHRGRHGYGGERHHSEHYGHAHSGSEHGLGDDPEDPDDDRGDGKGDMGGEPDIAPIQITEDENQIQFRDLVKQGALKRADPLPNETSPRYLGTGGFERIWDSCSETPFLRSAAAGQVVTYDDPESLVLKARFAKEAGMLGVNIFDVHGDTADYHLTDSARRGLGLVSGS
ncbi:glycoside hydrolase [Coprinopsis marcescibilis]|uniref:Glycoside hydrolase n=1 Tax=Coprinopsis marcescibilis TaxID=230819 RepID=A0A5C3L990_COPMA|nr:glycoside hydrolase [Coprinopsis marcescibilis]